MDVAVTWRREPRPGVAWEDTIIYEAHVKGLTRCARISRRAARNFHGLSAPGMVDHLKRLGVTTLELLPIHAFVDEPSWRPRPEKLLGLQHARLLHPRSAVAERIDVLRSTVDRLHDAGIEVILDVVYNHTAKATILGRRSRFAASTMRPILALPDKPRYYENFTGSGNSLKLAHPRVLQMVDGFAPPWVEASAGRRFRFDLATTLGRRPGFDGRSPFFAAISQDPVLCNVKLIAEPWDIGLGGYQVGGFPTGWSEWNDFYRRTVRRFWRGEGNLIGDLAHCMTASAAQFQHNGRGPRSSINHVTVHDGFTLADLVSYEHKHNEANGEDSRDGSDDNLSANCGVEGATDDTDILSIRRRLRRNQLACLFLAQGVPLLLAGDEAPTPGRQQQRVLPGQREQAGSTGPARQRRRTDRLRRRACAPAPALPPAQAAPLGRGQEVPTAHMM